MALLFPLGLSVSWFLSRQRRFWGRSLVETILLLPLVLPPTVVGFGLLLLFGRGTGAGRWLQDVAHVSLLFTWQGAAVAGAVMGLPLFIRTASATLAAVDGELIEAARTLGASEWRILWAILVPLGYRGILAATTLAFARVLGEFGATLMIAGSIPGETETLPLALYSAVQAGNNTEAVGYASLLLLLAFVCLGLSLVWGETVATRRGE